jgi:transcriptional regulator with XRE-family HTH domain
MAKGSKTAKLDEIGIDEICDRIVAGDSQSQIAADAGVSIALLSAWLGANPERSARAREARIAAARQFDEKAEAELRAASDPFTLARARELAQHYRWKASKASPKEYGDKIEIDQKTTLVDLTDEQLDARLAQLIAAGG